MILAEALSLVEYYREAMAPFCERIEIAGSIRRRKNEVKDIEIVCVPRIDVQVSTGLFGEELGVRRNLLFEWAMRSGVYWIKPGASQVIEWTIKPEGKYWRGLVRGGESIKLDIFLTTLSNFGTTLLIRTGSAEFNVAIMNHARRLNRNCVSNHFHLEGEPQEFAEEAQVFQFLDLAYVRPRDRVDGRALRQSEAA